MPSRSIPDTFRLARAATRSGFRRYPRVIAESLRDLVRGADEGHGGLGSHGGPVSREEFLRVYDLENAAAWLGHASVLLRFDHRTALVDPVLSARIGPRVGGRIIGPARLTPSPVRAADLRESDAVLITHAHFDHLDRPTLERIASTKTVAIVARGLRSLMPTGFREVVELDWGNRFELEGFAVRAVEPAHWGARTAFDRRRSFNAYVIESDAGLSLATGDTAHTRAFDALDPIDLAIFGIGAYDPWEHQHATPEQVWDMFTAIGGVDTPNGLLLPVHHSTFELSDEPADEPMRRLMAAAGDRSDHVLGAKPGDVFELKSNTQTQAPPQSPAGPQTDP